MRRLPLIEVEWDDASSHSNWEFEDFDFPKSQIHCKSVGWKIKGDRKNLVITPMRSWYNNDKNTAKCSDTQTIPRGCIRNIRRIE